MQKYDLKNQALSSQNGEYIFGAEDTGSHACYMIYGILKPGEAKRLIRPGKGHEEMVLASKGALEVSGHVHGHLDEGSAIHIIGETSVYLENAGLTEAVYVIAGGHSTQGHRH
jgi:hypothetical protein